MTVSDLYRDVVLAHNRAPHRYGTLSGATHAADGDNPLCGDRLRFELRLADGRVADLRFSGEACAIAIAASSLLGDLASGHDATDVDAWQRAFADWLRTPGAEAPAVLGDLRALEELQRYPARHRCALLPFETLSRAFATPTA